MGKKATEGVFGGIDLLDPIDRVHDSEISEQVEPLNLRDGDPTTETLQLLLGRKLNGYMQNKQFSVQVPGSRDTEITFDRHYWEIGLLIDYRDTAYNDWDREANNKHVQTHAAFAHERGMKYLCIVGSATLAQVEQAIR